MRVLNATQIKNAQLATAMTTNSTGKIPAAQAIAALRQSSITTGDVSESPVNLELNVILWPASMVSVSRAIASPLQPGRPADAKGQSAPSITSANLVFALTVSAQEGATVTLTLSLRRDARVSTA